MKKKNEIDKNLRLYSKYYRQLLINEGIKDIEAKMASYETRLLEIECKGHLGLTSIEYKTDVEVRKQEIVDFCKSM